MIDDDTGHKREAFSDDLTQPQQLFLFYAKEERKRMRQEDSGADTPQNQHSQTHHIS